MWFKNLQVYRFPAPWNITASSLEEQLGRQAFRGATGFEMQSQGWTSPREGEGLVHSVQGQMLLSLCTEKKLLPSSVIKDDTGRISRSAARKCRADIRAASWGCRANPPRAPSVR